MGPVIQSLFDRKSVRIFTEEPVAKEDKALLFQAAFQAPTAGCQQLYAILDVTDDGEKGELARLCDHQDFIAKAPVVLVFCADCRRWLKAYRLAGLDPRRPGLGDALLAMTDAVIAAQNVVTAAQALGLGSCYIGDVIENQEQVKALLSLPEYVFPAALLVLGHPTQQQKDRPKPERFQEKYVVFENRYRDLEDGELREMFRGKTGQKSFEEWMEAFCRRKYESEFSLEMSRSAGRWLEDFS